LRNEYGYSDVRVGSMTSGLSSIQVVESDFGESWKSHGKGRKHRNIKLVGGADHRRDGTVGGR
jgi:hypothetical protein